MIVSVTERGTFKRCRQQWEYASRNRQGITPIQPASALALGTMVHKVHEAWLLEPDKDVEILVMEVAKTSRDELKEAYRKSVGAYPSDEEEVMVQFFEQVMLVREMMTNYQAYWGASLPKGYTLVKPEQTVLVPIPGTAHACDAPVHQGSVLVPKLTESCEQCNGTGTAYHYLEGTLDALIRNEQGLLWVLERKTYGQRPRLETLEENDQFLAYVWILTMLDIGPVGGILYDGMWKREATTKRGLDDLFIRHTLTRTQAELRNFEIELRREVEDMVNPNIYRNFKWDGCWDCGFRPLCLAEYRGEDSEWIRNDRYTKRELVTWIEEESIA